MRMKHAELSVSVVIPVYNRFPMLLEALESVGAQTEPADEIIVVDDGSLDIAHEQAQQIKALDPRVIYLRIDHCGMPGAVRNAGVDAARGEWVALLDSDDLWLPDKLALQKQCAASRPDVPLVHTRERWVRGGREISQAGQRHRRDGWIFPDALVKCVIGPSTVMMRRELYRALGGFRPDLEVAEDYEFWLRVTAHHLVAYVARPLVEKRAGHGEQLSEKYGHIEQFRIDGLERLVAEGYFSRVPPSSVRATRQAAQPTAEPTTAARAADLEQLARAELARKCRIYAAGAIKRGRQPEADHYRALADRHAPH